MTLARILIEAVSCSDLGAVGITRQDLLRIGGERAVAAANHLAQLNLLSCGHALEGGWIGVYFPNRERFGSYANTKTSGRKFTEEYWRRKKGIA